MNVTIIVQCRDGLSHTEVRDADSIAVVAEDLADEYHTYGTVSLFSRTTIVAIPKEAIQYIRVECE